MKKFHAPAATQWVSWCTTALLIITAVTPVLPPGTPPWVTHAMLIAATILAVLTTRLGDKPRIGEDAKPPTETP
jgi:hypothetical protein